LLSASRIAWLIPITQLNKPMQGIFGICIPSW
jgi:hypothetical protein